MTALRLGSLFDGIGVFPLAAVRCGIEPVWASEIENAPISITSWERFHQMTGWILEPSYPLSQTPTFQCLLLEDGQEPEWCEGERLTSAGGSWTPSIGQAPGWHDGSASFLWQTLEDGVPTKYFLSPAQCSHFLRLAEIAGCPPPAEIEALLLKQGGAYQSPDPFNASVCGHPPRSGRKQRSETASDCQLTLFPLC